jgi:hypothetical protein
MTGVKAVRSHIAFVLDMAGHNGVMLDDCDLWVFEEFEQRG